MRVECPHCNTKGNIDDSLIPAGGRNIRCPKCRDLFLVGGTSVSDTSAVDTSASASGTAPIEEPSPSGTGVSGDFGGALQESPSAPSPHSENPYLLDADSPPPDSTAKDLFDQQTAQSGGNFAYGVNFIGTGGALFLLYAKNLVFTVLTLGIYYFWGKVKVLKFLASQTELGRGDSFTFHGEAKMLFKGAAIAGVVYVTVTLLFEYLATFHFAFSLIFIFLFLMAVPFAVIGTIRYRFGNTSWRGVYFSFRGVYKTYLKIFLKGVFFIIPTLSFYIPFWHANSQRFFRQNTHFGTMNFGYTGVGKEIFKTIYIKAFFLIPLTAGIYYFWYKAKLIRYDWEHTTFNGLNFSSTITGSKLLMLQLTNMLLLTFTLGLAFSWVKTRTLTHKFSWVQIEGDADLDKIVQDIIEGGQTGEGLADIFDFDIGMFLSW